MRIRKVNSVDVKLYDLSKVKLKTAGNTSVVQFTTGDNKTCSVVNLSKDTYLDKRTGEVKTKRKSESRCQSPESNISAYINKAGIYDIAIKNEWIYPKSGVVFSIKKKSPSMK